MRPEMKTGGFQNKYKDDDLTQVSQTPLGQQLIRIWPRLLGLPLLHDRSNTSNHDSQQMESSSLNGRHAEQSYPYEISIIVPCFREQTSLVRQNLAHALKTCVAPERIQLVLVDATNERDENNSNKLTLEGLGLTVEASINSPCFVNVKIIPYPYSQGRGPSLNLGARHADGRIYSFCHSDTRLPQNWDVRISEMFDETNDTNVLTNSCAFGFGIDTSPQGLNGKPCPVGIRAVERTANLRCKLWSLPYGDQCLSIPAQYFWHLGGFPHQPIMEDYDMIRLLRLRSALMHQFNQQKQDSAQGAHPNRREALKMIPGSPALCSPRRWQRYGVLYVTYTNSKLVNLYAGGTSPEEIYRLYYGPRESNSSSETEARITQDKRTTSFESPWEVELQSKLQECRMFQKNLSLLNELYIK